MNNALQATLKIGLERKHITIRGQGHIVILKIVGDIVTLSIFLGFAQTALMQGTYFTAYQQKTRRAFIFQRTIITNTTPQSRKGKLRQWLFRGKFFKRG